VSTGKVYVKDEFYTEARRRAASLAKEVLAVSAARNAAARMPAEPELQPPPARSDASRHDQSCCRRPEVCPTTRGRCKYREDFLRATGRQEVTEPGSIADLLQNMVRALDIEATSRERPSAGRNPRNGGVRGAVRDNGRSMDDRLEVGGRPTTWRQPKFGRER